MNLDFLSPAAAVTVPARGPMLAAAAAAAPVTEVRDGWEVVASFGDPAGEVAACAGTVGFTDLSHLTKLEISLANPRGGLDGLADHDAAWWVCQVRPDLQLIVSSIPGGDRLEAPVPPGSRVVDLTGSLGALGVVGPAARELFARFCALDLRESALPLRGFRLGSVARTPGYVLRQGPCRFLVLFGAAYGEYVWEVVADAAERLGGRPVGLDAYHGSETGDA